MGWQTFAGVRQSRCNGFHCLEVAQKEVMERWMLIKCSLAPVHAHLKEWRHVHAFLELNFKFYFAGRVRWLTIAVRFHSITHVHTQTHANISIAEVCSPWSGRVREKERAHVNTWFEAQRGRARTRFQASVFCRLRNAHKHKRVPPIEPNSTCLLLSGLICHLREAERNTVKKRSEEKRGLILLHFPWLRSKMIRVKGLL